MAIGRHVGVVLTNAPSIAVVDDTLRRGGYNTLKVVTGWGLPGGWSAETIAQAVRLAPELIVRTQSGDPSLDGHFGGDHAYVDIHRVEEEIAPWYRARPDIWVELGNEPNIFPITVDQMYIYAYYVKTAIAMCRSRFPKAKIIAPAMATGGQCAEQFLAICKDAIRLADAAAIHAYEWSAFDGPVAGRKGELEQAFALAAKLFPAMAWWLTEYGINDKALSPAMKGQRYGALLHARRLPEQLLGATYYHLAVDAAVNPEYHIYPQGDVAYHRQRFSTS